MYAPGVIGLPVGPAAESVLEAVMVASIGFTLPTAFTLTTDFITADFITFFITAGVLARFIIIGSFMRTVQRWHLSFLCILARGERMPNPVHVVRVLAWWTCGVGHLVCPRLS